MTGKPLDVARPPHLPVFLSVIAPVLLATALGAARAQAADASTNAAANAAGASASVSTIASANEPATAPVQACPWPAWQAFQTQFLQPDGRVLDPASPRAHTVSEAQAYALFFALVADDRAVFERILRWTEDNLAAGDLALRLPAWQWGRHDDQHWAVLDDNPAADADLWLAYALAEAGRRWDERRYRALSSLLAERILREETALIPGLGRTLLPGARGFEPVAGVWRLNPSYAPPFLLRWFARHSGDPRWEAVRASAVRVLRESAPRGFAPDWAFYREPAAMGEAGAFLLADRPASERTGSYDAIRVYLWVGMTSAADPERAALLQHFSAMTDVLDAAGAPPAAVDAATGKGDGSAGPPGFSAALLPAAVALGRGPVVQALRDRLHATPPAAGAYYDQALALFGRGRDEGRFAFAADGSLLAGPLACPAEAARP